MPLYDYRCADCKQTRELIRPMSVTGEVCLECGGIAERVPYNKTYMTSFETMSFGPTSFQVGGQGMDIEHPQTREKFRRFQEASQEIDHAYSKREADVGHPVQGPNLWKEAQRGALKVTQAGEAPRPVMKGTN